MNLRLRAPSESMRRSDTDATRCPECDRPLHDEQVRYLGVTVGWCSEHGRVEVDTPGTPGTP